MSRKVVVYMSSTKHVNDKDTVLIEFANGVRKSNCLLHMEYEKKYVEGDIAVILGYYSEINIKKNPFHALRKTVCEEQISRGHHMVYIDSDVLLSHPVHYRIAFGNAMPCEAKYFNENSPDDRWKQLVRRKNLEVRDWRKDGEHIVVLMQSKEGWAIKGFDEIEWTNKTIARLREYTDRPIVARPKPNSRRIKPGDIVDPLDNVILSDSKRIPLHKDIQRAWAAVTFNSGAGAQCIVKGIPVFVSDYNNMYQEIANDNIRHIEDPILFDRTQWFNDLAYSMWNVYELREGMYWQRLMEHSGLF